MKFASFTSVSFGEPLLINPERVGGVRRGRAIEGNTSRVDGSVLMLSGGLTKHYGYGPLAEQWVQPEVYTVAHPHTVILVDGQEIYVLEEIETVLERLGITEVTPPVSDWGPFHRTQPEQASG